MNIPLDEVMYFDAITSSPTTQAATDADSTPTFAVYEESTDTDIGVGGNLTKRTSLTGNYRGSFTLSAANGFEVGKWYSVIVSATVGAVAAKGVVKNFRVVAAEAIAGVPKTDDGTLMLSGTLTSGSGPTLTPASTYTATIVRAGQLIICTDISTGEVNYRTIVSGNGTTITINTALDFTVAAGDTFKIFALGNVNAEQIAKTPQTAVDIGAYLTPILLDTNELQTDWVNGGRLDSLIDLIATYIDTEVAAIKTKTDQLVFGVANALNVNLTHWATGAVPTPAATGVPTTNVGYWSGSANLPRNAREFFVSSGGNDANAGTYDSPFLTFGAANTAARSGMGDRIRFLSSLTGRITPTKHGLTICGQGIGTVITDTSANGTFAATGVHHLTLEDIKLVSTGTGSGSTGTWSGDWVTKLVGCNNLTIRRASFLGGNRGCVSVQGGNEAKIVEGTIIRGYADGLNLRACRGFLVSDCDIGTDANPEGTATRPGVGGDASGAAALWAGTSSVGLVQRTYLEAIKASYVTDSQLVMAVELSSDDDDEEDEELYDKKPGRVVIDGCTLIARVLKGSGGTNRVAGIGGILTSSVIRASITNSQIQTYLESGNAGTEYAIDTRTETSDVQVRSVQAERDKFNMVASPTSLSGYTITDHDVPVGVATKLDTMLTADGGGGDYKYTDDALQEAPSGGSDGGTAAQVHNEEPIHPFIAKLGNRRDGIMRAYPTLYLAPTTEAHIWIDCSSLLADNITNVTGGESTDEDVAEITSLGMYAKYASFKFDTSGGESGQTATLTCVVPRIGPVCVDIEIKTP